MQNVIPSYYLQQLTVYRRKGCNDADTAARNIFDRYIKEKQKMYGENRITDMIELLNRKFEW